jgi:uncharacterized protein (DUF2062 family)
MIDGTKKILRRVTFLAARRLLAKKNSSPSYLGRTFAVGLCAGMFIIYVQSLQCLAVWLVMDRWLKLRFNVLIASLLTFISNPVTTPFILYLYYLTGQAILGDSVVSLSSFLTQARILLFNIDRGNMMQGLKLVAMGIGWPIMLGSLPWHILMAFLGYGIGVRVHWRLYDIMTKKKFRKSIEKQEKADASAETAESDAPEAPADKYIAGEG